MIQPPKPGMDENPGSQGLNEPGFLVVGRLLKPHGLKGELRMKVFTDFPERLAPGNQVFVGDHNSPVTIRTIRWHKDTLIIQFEGISNRQEADQLRSQWVKVPRQDRPPLPEGEYYHHELVGSEVIAREGNYLGRVTEILATGANDVLIVRHGEKELLLPFTDEVILDVDLELGRITINLLPGIQPKD